MPDALARVMTPGGSPFAKLGSWIKQALRAWRRPVGQAPLPQPPQRPYPWEACYPEGLTWDFTASPQPLFTILDEAVARYGPRMALEFLGRRISYTELGDLVDRAAKGFQELGLGRGDRVGLFLPNSPYFVICYYAILKAGGTVVNFNPLYAGREIARQIRDSGVQIMVTMDLQNLYPQIAARFADTGLEKIVVCRMSRALPLPISAMYTLFRRKENAIIPADERHCWFEKLTANKGDYTPIGIDPEKDVAVLQFTGGTTGVPKGAALTHASLYSNCLQTRRWATGLKDGEACVLAVLPLFHVFGMTAAMNVSLLCGAQIVLQPRFKVVEVLNAIEKYKINVMFGVPTMYSAINAHEDVEDRELSSLRFCISGGASLPAEVKDRFESLTGSILVEGYGLTEAGPVCTINPIDGVNKPLSAGLPIPGTLIEVTALDDPDRVLPLGEQGEICVTGPQVMAGYALQPEETASALRGGRLHTGDVGYLDADGYLFIVDRIKDLIINGGFNVYPRMVEEAVRLHPDVADVAVCGVPDKHRGETVKAFVVKQPGSSLTGAELRSFLKDKLAPFEQPRRVSFVENIPKTMLGKPLRRELLEQENRDRIEREAQRHEVSGTAPSGDSDVPGEPEGDAPA